MQNRTHSSMHVPMLCVGKSGEHNPGQQHCGQQQPGEHDGE